MIEIRTEDGERSNITRSDIIPIVQAIATGRPGDALIELGLLFKRDADVAEWIEQARFAAKRAIA